MSSFIRKKLEAEQARNATLTAELAQAKANVSALITEKTRIQSDIAAKLAAKPAISSVVVIPKIDPNLRGLERAVAAMKLQVKN